MVQQRHPFASDSVWESSGRREPHLCVFSHIHEAGFDVYWTVLLRCSEAIVSARRIFGRLGGGSLSPVVRALYFAVAALGEFYDITNEGWSEWPSGPNLPDDDGVCNRCWDGDGADAVGHARPGGGGDTRQTAEPRPPRRSLMRAR